MILKKQRAIERIAPMLQYSVPPLELLQDNEDETVWESPVRDAVDILIDAMVNRAGLRRNGLFENETFLNSLPYNIDPPKWNLRYSNVYI